VLDTLAHSTSTLNTELALDAIADKAARYAKNARSTNTQLAYKSDLKSFNRWCRSHALSAFPATAKTVSLYVADVAGTLKPSTLQRRLAAISVQHKAAGYDSPTSHEVVRSVLSGVKRRLGVAQTQKAALGVGDVRAMVDGLGNVKAIDVRDRALLLLGFGGAFRRSELVALDVADVGFEPEGVVVALHRSKTNQEGETERIAVPYGSNHRTCPVRALQAWIAVIGDGPLFRRINQKGEIGHEHPTDHSVALIVKKRASNAGLDPATVAGHSLRSGFATSAARAGKSEASIMRQTRHKSVTVARRYIRQGTRWDDHAGHGIGL
jgi:site-specific recombinase XerD